MPATHVTDSTTATAPVLYLALKAIKVVRNRNAKSIHNKFAHFLITRLTPLITPRNPLIVHGGSMQDGASERSQSTGRSRFPGRVRRDGAG
jgi:hypothetical protein